MPTADQDKPLPSTSDAPPSTLHIFAARILPHPPPPVARAPRPDDPTPRRPRLFVTSAAKRKASSSSLHADGLKRAKSAMYEDEQVRRAREVMLHGPRVGLAEGGLKRSKSSRAIGGFKVPQLPARAGSLDSIISLDSVPDPFGGEAASGKGKGKEGAEQPGSAELEKANKTVRRWTLRSFGGAADNYCRLSSRRQPRRWPTTASRRRTLTLRNSIRRRIAGWAARWCVSVGHFGAHITHLCAMLEVYHANTGSESKARGKTYPGAPANVHRRQRRALL